MNTRESTAQPGMWTALYKDTVVIITSPKCHLQKKSERGTEAPTSELVGASKRPNASLGAPQGDGKKLVWHQELSVRPSHSVPSTSLPEGMSHPLLRAWQLRLREGESLIQVAQPAPSE